MFADLTDGTLSNPNRGEVELAVYAQAMQHELADNEHKGHWSEAEDGSGRKRPIKEMVSDLLYHVIKLDLAVQANNLVAVLEYAADVGNCAMFVADTAGALNLDLLHDGPVEYDEEIDPVAKPADFAEFKRMAHDWAGQVWA